MSPRSMLNAAALETKRQGFLVRVVTFCGHDVRQSYSFGFIIYHTSELKRRHLHGSSKAINQEHCGVLNPHWKTVNSQWGAFYLLSH